MNYLSDRLSKEDAVRVLRRCVEEGFIQFLPHSLERCKERGVGLQEVVNVLKRGMIFSEPELDVRRNQWRYKVEGRTSEGEELAVIVAFADENTTVVITVISP
jgi:uncharacterized DUF497 family protein